ncbi:DUF4351 domain-containing protein [Spirulina subsalsa]|uniref:DUF4351 domain-containing protein n=1 Tax=Spirulina subsalsa TaxID=54311 RepID=UPI0002D4DB28|nr:DUF4351 domain-containing protein [Spirulina subsalsa]
MTKKADIGSKRLISLAPEAWVNWVTQRNDLTVEAFLSSEFQWISRENDVLLKVNSPDHGPFLVLTELQLRPDRQIPLRIRAYTALAEERYNLPVYPVLINILPPSANPNIPNAYRSQFLGIEAVQSYRVINLWEVDVALVFREGLSSLLPFVPILRGGNEREVIQQALQELRAEEDLQELEPLLAFFASFVLNLQVVQDILRWDMAILRESPWYQEILNEGLQQGLQQGLEQGQFRLVFRQINRRFGELPARQREIIEGFSESQLDDLLTVLPSLNTLEELATWCASEASQNENPT